MTSIHGEGQGQGEQRHRSSVGLARAPLKQEHCCGDDPTQEAHGGGLGPSQPTSEGAAQLEDGAGENRSEVAQAQDAAQKHDARPSDDHLDQDPDRVGVAHRDQYPTKAGSENGADWNLNASGVPIALYGFHSGR